MLLIWDEMKLEYGVRKIDRRVIEDGSRIMFRAIHYERKIAHDESLNTIITIYNDVWREIKGRLQHVLNPCDSQSSWFRPQSTEKRWGLANKFSFSSHDEQSCYTRVRAE